MRQPRCPDDQDPHRLLQPELALCLPTLDAQRLAMHPRCGPGLLPLAIAHGVAQHQHRVDVLPIPAHASAFEACFDHQLVRTLDTA